MTNGSQAPERAGSIDVPPDLRPLGPGESAPPRRPLSVRRTSTMDFTWPSGIEGDVRLDGRSRDLLTTVGAGALCGTAALQIETDDKRVIKSIASDPGAPGLDGLVGASSMSRFRTRLAELLDRGVVVSNQLLQLLDDLPGATLISGAAFRPMYPREEYLELRRAVSQRVMTDICTGYQAGSSALKPDGTLRWSHEFVPGPDIRSPEDGLAWHEMAVHRPGVASARRARRLDVWEDGGVVRIDAFYQDSVLQPDGVRQVVHEYALTAAVSGETLKLTEIAPVPRVLPYTECPLATVNSSRLVGESLANLRARVLQVLSGPAGCTHLNDMMRSLSDVPHLIEYLGTRSRHPDITPCS